MHYPQAKRSALLVLVAIMLALGGCGPAPPPAARAPAVSEGLKEINGTQLYYKTVGEGEPIIFLHGGGGSHRYFLPHLEPLANERQLIFYDQRGTGLSDGKLDLRAISVDQFVEDLEALRLSFGFEKISLIGHSWGAIFAMFYAFKYQDRIDRLILVDMPPVNSSFAADLAATRSQRLQKLSADEQRTFTTTCPRPDLPAEALAECARLAATVDFYEPEKALGLDPTTDENTAKNAQTVRSLILTSFNRVQNNIDSQLETVRTPTLIIHGDFDPIPLASSEYVHQHIAASQMLIIQESGHFPFIEQPEKFIEAVRAFLHT